jgi:hypothetical protein
MAYSLQVYDPTNTTYQGTLVKAYDIGWNSDLRVPGGLAFRVNIADTTDMGLLAPLRVVRVHDGTQDIEAYVVRDQPAELVVAEDEGRPHVQFVCDHILTRLGYRTGGAVLRPYGDLAGLQQSPRWFGPMGFDFIERTGIPEPVTGGASTREGWLDDRAEVLECTTRGLFRRYLTGNGTTSPARMWCTSTAWSIVKVWWDGAEVPALSQDIGDRSIRMWDLPYDGEDHIIFFDVSGSDAAPVPAGQKHRVVWTYSTLAADDLGEFNDWGTMEGRLFTTFNSTTYSGPTAPTAPYWQAWDDYADEDYPGVNVGYVAGVAFDEAQTRGLLTGLTRDFDEDEDSGGEAWEHEFVHAFRMQRVGHLLDELSAWKCEPTVTPAGVFRIWQQRGTDRTGTVTITLPFSLSATGRGPQATRYLTETDTGFGEVIDTAAETALGEPLEDYISLGADLHPHTAAGAVTEQLASDSVVRNELEVQLPDTLVPYDDVFLGDIVQSRTDADGTVGPVRLTSFRAERLDNRVRWFSMLEPA